MKTEDLIISCPYCQIGHAKVPAMMEKGVCQVPDIKMPRKCVTCGQYMVLVPKVDIRGITMEQAAREGRDVV